MAVTRRSRLDRLWRLTWRSIRGRLLVALLVPMGLIMVTTLPWDFRTAVAPSARAYDESLQIEAQALLDAVQVEDGVPVLVLTRQAERLLRANAVDTEYFAVHDTTGRFIAGDAVLGLRTVPRDAQPRFEDRRLSLPGGAEVPVRVVVLARTIGPATVVAQVAETTSRRRAAELRIGVAMVLPNVLIAVVGVLALYLATRVGLAPMEHLAHEVRQRSPDDLRPLWLRDTPLELATVLAALNRLFARVNQAAHTQQRFHANVAHQLRTPLAGLRMQIELAQSDDDAATRAHRFEGMLAAVDRMSHLIDQLLTLARAEAGGLQSPRLDPLDLVALVEQRAAAWLDQAAARHIDLGFELQPVPLVTGNAVLLGELVGNLVDNAMRHCPVGSSVTVSCEPHQGGVRLAVEDNGPGIDPAQRAQLFGRFQRGTATAAEGSGLGLAIVQEIAQLHGATVRCMASSAGQGTRFEVVWAGVGPSQGGAA